MALAIIAEGNDACKIAYCRVCLDVFTQITGRGRPRKRCNTCKVAERPTKPRVYKYKPKRRIKAEYSCQHCGKTFRPFSGNKAKYCSHQCAFEQQRIDRKAAREKRASLRPGPYCKVYVRNCQVCAAAFFGASKSKRICSDECLKKQARVKARQRNEQLKIVVPRKCAECSTIFVPQYGDKRRSYCSDLCLRKASRRVRNPKHKARLRAARVESVDPFKVFDRDGWRCQICHKPTPKRLRGTIEHNAPELDHIVPLARGGEHSYRNTQCACRKCNGRKSDSVYGQLNLFVA